ncbi:MAG: PA14 domain-containing protein, partial [Limisphaerales bacterium]
MNTSIVPSRAAWKQFAFWLAACALMCATSVRAQTNSSAGAFVEPLQFTTVDTVVDPTDGSSYVLGRNDLSQAILKKYDSSGTQIFFDGATSQDITISGITPNAITIGVGTTNLYIVGDSKILKVSSKSGSVVTTNDANNANLKLQGVRYWNGTVYAVGTFTGASTSFFGKSATQRGNQAGVIIKFDASLSSTALGLITYGNDTGYNTANSIVVDDSGDIYVAGHLDTGTFRSDVFTSGAWTFNRKHATSVAVSSLPVAAGVLDGTYASTSDATTFPSTINFFTPDLSGYYNYVTHVTGVLQAPTSGIYSFVNRTDDGTSLYVDGQQVIYDTFTHGATDEPGSMSLFAGLHYVDWVQFNQGGPGSGEFAWTPPGGSRTDVPAANFALHQNVGYVLKFGGDLQTIKSAYFSTTAFLGSGGEYYELHYAQGWVYAVGFWKGIADNGGIGSVDNSSASSADMDIVKLDTGLQLKARAKVKGAADNSGYSITSDDAGNAYVTGSYGPQSVDFYGQDDAANKPFASRSASQTSIFIAALDPNMDFKWINQPSGTPPSFSFTSSTTKPKVRWNTALQRTLWEGYFGSGTLTMGNANALKTIDGPKGFLAVLDPTGTFTERVNLTVLSDYGLSGSQIKPFGGPALNTNSFITATNTRPVIKGVQVTVSVPNYLYRDITNGDITILTQTDSSKIDSLAETRIGCTGYSVGENVANGTATSYTFTLNNDTLVKFNWLVEHALRISDDFSSTEGTDTVLTPGHIVGLKSEAAGNPVPAVQKHWIQENDTVIASVDSEVADLNYLSQGLPVKYVVTGYNASGPPNTLTTGTTNIAFVGSDVRRQVPQFVMSGPASIQYVWRLKIGVQVGTTGVKSTTFPLVRVTSDPGGVVPPKQSNGSGSGTFYFDENTSLQVGTLKAQNTTQLKGWLNGDGTTFSGTGDVTNLNTSFTLTNNGTAQLYGAMAVAQLRRPVRVLWDYGDRIFDETVYIGNPVTFSTVDDTLVKAKLLMTNAPDHVDIISAPQGSAPSDMGIWDDAGKKFYPLRPGQVFTYWYTSADPAERVIIRLTIKYPLTAHYRHIASTPAVNLDPSTNDLVNFKALKYTEPTTGAAVDSSHQFTATGRGKTVLLFGELSSAGRGGQIETLRVRVVDTKAWNDSLPAIQTAVIGQAITSSYDTAGLGTGYLFFPNARYNPFVYNRTTIKGPIIPVNLNPTAGATEQLVVVWYEVRDTILWGYQAVRYDPAWPTPSTGLNRIVIASRFGSESVAQDGTDQIITPATTVGTNIVAATTMIDPARFQQVQIYNQPDRTQPGFNPNEEHALLAPSLRNASVSPRPQAVYALRDNDLNVTNRDATYTSDPYVLVQFLDALDNRWKMKVYNIVRAATNLNAGDLSYEYSFKQDMLAGEPVIPFYPLVQVIGATPCPGSYGRDGQPSTQLCFWKDHKGTAWAVSGDSYFYESFMYPLLPDFWWPTADNKQPGDCVMFLPNTPHNSSAFFNINYTRNDQTPEAQAIQYNTSWPDNVPTLKVGETLTFPGGEYHQDNPTTAVVDDNGDVQIEDTPGLPGVVGFAAAQIVYDTVNPVMNDQLNFDHYSARVFQALEQRTVPFAVNQLPAVLNPANKRTEMQNGMYVFVELPSSLQKRVFFDPIQGVLGVRGFLNDKSISDSTLTASPPAVYVLEPNVLTSVEKAILDGSAANSPFKDLAGTPFAAAMDALYDLSRNPNGLDQGNNGVDQGYRVGLEQKVIVDSTTGLPQTTTVGGITTVLRDKTKAASVQALGPGLALVANPSFLDPNNPTQISYVTVAENNSDALGGSPVILHIIKIDKNQRYRGAIKTILSNNVFDENIVLRHTGDFGGNADDLVFEWWYRPEDGTTALTPDRQPIPSPWKLFADPSGAQGAGFYQLTLKGNPSAPEALLADTLFFVRYRHKNEVTSGINWEVPQSNNERRCVLNDCKPGIPYDWAGAGNSSPRDVDGDGQPDYQPQLAEGWIKRVLDRVNPYEARINDFSGDNPATYSSILEELGARYEGAVALNGDKNVIENVGLIALYETILNRGRSLSIDLSTPVSTPAIANALQLASTRLSDFYTLLGNEAYSDALNPAIGYGSSSVEYGNLAPSVFAFQNQVSSLLDEELALLRGQDAFAGTPVYNRLFWNFTKGEGEAAYAMKYDISDVNKDGFIDENDAMILYPQGHGDAWGHYLTAIKMQYELLRHPFFNWVSRSEFYNLQDVVIPVDFLDERKFAQVAAQKAQVGAEIVNMTYRANYVADPKGQWQGYTDTDKNRSWGVEEWARRAGQGAYFDWITANALLPAVHPNTNYTGIQKVDRTTVQDIAMVSANLTAIQTTMDQVDNGNNPLGLATGALTFDIDPTLSDTTGNGVAGQPMFEQVYDRALKALRNAKTTFDNANKIENLIRKVADSQAEFQNKITEQDLSYRNQLIEIFGTPYAGTIGSGKAYPPGYQGPDTMLYMYVPVNTLNDGTVPQPTASYYGSVLTEITGANATFINGSGSVSGVYNTFKARYGLTFGDQNSITNSINYTDFSDTNADPVVNTLDNLNLPIMANGYTFVAPSDWGIRTSPGELQGIINKMVQAQADLNARISDWDGAQSGFVQQLQLCNTKFDYN